MGLKKKPVAGKRKAAVLAAASVIGGYQNERPVNDPWLNELMSAGQQFWKSRGVNLPPTSFNVAEGLGEGVAGRGDTDGSGRFIVDSRETGIELTRARSKRRSASERRKALQRLARTIFHELGHTGGIQHTSDGIMGPGADVLPYDAEVLIRKLIPRGKKQPRRRGPIRGSSTDG